MATHASHSGYSYGVLPDAESVRLAYIAMFTDPSISAIYIESQATGQEADAIPARRNFFCMLRPASIELLPPDSTLLKQQVSFSELDSELSIIDKQRPDTRGYMLLMKPRLQ